jgi:hypothetical protein
MVQSISTASFSNGDYASGLQCKLLASGCLESRQPTMHWLKPECLAAAGKVSQEKCRLLSSGLVAVWTLRLWRGRTVAAIGAELVVGHVKGVRRLPGASLSLSC